MNDENILIEQYKIKFPDGSIKYFDIEPFNYSTSVSGEFEKLTGLQFNSLTVQDLIKQGYQVLFIGFKNKE